MASTRMRQHGFTMLEVLISIVVLSIGLLGIAGMQATSMSNNHLAYVKTQAAILATDLADRIRANPDGLADYDGFDTRVAIADPGCIAAGCTPAQLAQYDLFQWQQPFERDFKPALPNGRGSVTVNGQTVTISVLWTEPNNDALGRFQCAGIDDQGANESCFELVFQP